MVPVESGRLLNRTATIKRGSSYPRRGEYAGLTPFHVVQLTRPGTPGPCHWHGAMETFDDGLVAGTSKGTIKRVIELSEGVSRSARVLDAPAGQGVVSKYMRAKGHSVVALNLDQSTFKVHGVPLVISDMNDRLPFADESFRYVVCVDGIEHLENPYALIREFNRILAPCGHLLLTTPNISAIRSRAKYLLTGFHNKAKRPLTEERITLWHHINLMSFPELRYALHRSGFTITTIATNRVKGAAVPSALLYPFCALATSLALTKEKDVRQRLLNREIYRQLYSWPVSMGETLILMAVKHRRVSP